MEQIADEAAKLDPFHPGQGNSIRRVVESLDDPRWLGCEKWEIVIRSKYGKNVTIHFVYDKVLNLFDDFKFKN
jgi:hypothetical protein